MNTDELRQQIGRVIDEIHDQKGKDYRALNVALIHVLLALDAILEERMEHEHDH